MSPGFTCFVCWCSVCVQSKWITSVVQYRPRIIPIVNILWCHVGGVTNQFYPYHLGLLHSQRGNHDTVKTLRPGQNGCIGSNNGLAPNRRQVIIWTNDGPFHWYITQLQSWRIWVNVPHQSTQNNLISTTKQSTTKWCLCFKRYTFCWWICYCLICI